MRYVRGEAVMMGLIQISEVYAPRMSTRNSHSVFLEKKRKRKMNKSSLLMGPE